MLHCIFATNSISQLSLAANTATAATDLRFYAIIASVNTAAYHFRGHIWNSCALRALQKDTLESVGKLNVY